jgi:hypothetical protein
MSPRHSSPGFLVAPLLGMTAREVSRAPYAVIPSAARDPDSLEGPRRDTRAAEVDREFLDPVEADQVFDECVLDRRRREGA